MLLWLLCLLLLLFVMLVVVLQRAVYDAHRNEGKTRWNVVVKFNFGIERGSSTHTTLATARSLEEKPNVIHRMKT